MKIIMDGGQYFSNKLFKALLEKHGFRENVAFPYHVQTSGQVELSNIKRKQIFVKTENSIKMDWSRNNDDSLWEYKTSYKTPICTSLYQFVYGNYFHLPLELELKAMWAMKKLKFYQGAKSNKRVNALNMLDKFILKL